MLNIKEKKAYEVSCKGEDDSFIVFADSVGRAKVNIIGEYHTGTLFCDLVAKRVPKADFFVKDNPKLRMLDWSNPEHQKWMRINLNYISINSEEMFSCRNCRNRFECFPQCINCNLNCANCELFQFDLTEICEKYY